VTPDGAQGGRRPLWPRFLALALAGWLLLPSPAAAQRTVDSLCRAQGLEAENDLVRIRKAYSSALRAGIPEAQLQPFIEDILLHKLDCGQVVRVLDVSAELRRKGLPYFVVFSKVREGMVKEAPPALVVEAAEAKLSSLSASRDVLESLKTMGYRVRDFQNAAVVLSSYIEKGYTGPDIVTRIGNKGLQGAGFTALSGMLEKPVRRKER
jgi:hypothetical protein